MKRLLPALMGALVVLGWSGAARAELNAVTAAADTYVRRDNKGPYGTLSEIIIKNKGDGKMTRKALIRFQMGPAGTAHVPFEASLKLAVTANVEGGNTQFYVFGLAAPAIAGRQCQATFDEATLKYKSAYMDWLEDGGDGVEATSRCIWGHAPLGLLTVPPGLGTVTFSSPALLQYIRENTAASGGAVTFVLTRVGKDDDGMNFASRENTSFMKPTLSWTDRDALIFAGGTAPNPGVTGPQQFNGTLSIPLAGGTAITFPGASVTATYEGRRLKTFTGTVGVPQLPSTGIFSALSLSGPQMMIGYDYPSAFDEVGLPLDPGAKYFFMRQDSGLAIGVADLIELEPPTGSASTLIAIDPSTATVLSYTSDIPFGPLSIEEVAVGFSGKSGLVFTPYDNGSVEGVLTPFGGNLYLGGTVEIALEKATSSDKVDVSASLHGDAMVNADVTGFASKQQDWLRRLGMNGSASINGTVGDFAGISLELANGSIGYERYGDGSLPRLAFAGGASAPHIPNMPFQFNGNVHAAGVIDMNDNGNASFIELSGEFDPAIPSVPYDLDGTMRLGVGSGAFSGKVHFLGATMGCSGEVSPQKLRVSGSIKHNWTKSGWGIKVTLKPEVTLTPNSAAVSVSASGKACALGECTGVKIKDVGFNVSTGHFRVCVGVNSPIPGMPDIGETCVNI